MKADGCSRFSAIIERIHALDRPRRMRKAGKEAIMRGPIAPAAAQRSCFLFRAKAQRREEEEGEATLRLCAFA
jgi:hypothetical protein